jgi:predicted RNase H-like HicB family nuclease
VSLTAIVHQEQDIYVAQCPDVGTVSQGYTVEEAMASLKEATELYLETFPRPEGMSTSPTVFDIVVHA